MPKTFMHAMIGLWGALSLMACSPDHNWRQVALEGTVVKAQLPCKPDRAKRVLPLGGAAMDMQMLGCESAGATVALMTVALPAGMDANSVLLGWQKATLNNARVTEPLSVAPQPIWQGTGFLPMTASVRIQATGQKADGQAVWLDAAWGAVAEGDHVRLLHAVVYDRHAATELADTLMEAVRP